MSGDNEPYNSEGFNGEWGEDGWVDPVNERVGELNASEAELRDQFIEELQFDNNPLRAAIRCGFHRAVACKIADRFMSEPYVLRKLKEITIGNSLTKSDKSKDDMREIVMRQLLNESMNVMGGSPETRIKASTQLAKMLDMESATKVDVKTNATNNVMLVPSQVDMDEWERIAMNQQKTLVVDSQNKDKEHNDADK